MNEPRMTDWIEPNEDIRTSGHPDRWSDPHMIEDAIRAAAASVVHAINGLCVEIRQQRTAAPPAAAGATPDIIKEMRAAIADLAARIG